jgi:hypothetical protein
MKLRAFSAVAMACASMALSISTADAKSKRYDANGNDIRPRAWCGWWMRQQLGVADRAFNLARN